MLRLAKKRQFKLFHGVLVQIVGKQAGKQDLQGVLYIYGRPSLKDKNARDADGAKDFVYSHEPC
jgi:hypothetical protein